MSNNFQARINQAGKVTSFGELRNGDTFRAIGIDSADTYRKASSFSGAKVDGNEAVRFPWVWPVVIVETSILEKAAA